MKIHPVYLIVLALDGAALLAGAVPEISAAVAPPENQTTGCKVIQTVKPVYPVRLLNDGITHGETRVMLQIDSAGRLTDTLVTAYTHRGFADEALRVIPQWKFEPAQVAGKPAGSVVEVTFDFKMDDMVVIEHKHPKEEPDLEAGQYQFQPASLKQLDRIPTPIHVEPPFYPQKWADRGIKGHATVEFYIDETGRTRMPAVIAADDHMLAGAAIAAVESWRFEPPTEKGRPALVKAQQTFNFGSE
ncbi:MAG: TonB family protein [Verrucomicrobiota bacterium]|nr:TonB family protein [Verrucomicrobiota bacterium]